MVDLSPSQRRLADRVQVGLEWAVYFCNDLTPHDRLRLNLDIVLKSYGCVGYQCSVGNHRVHHHFTVRKRWIETVWNLGLACPNNRTITLAAVRAPKVWDAQVWWVRTCLPGHNHAGGSWPGAFLRWNGMTCYVSGQGLSDQHWEQHRVAKVRPLYEVAQQMFGMHLTGHYRGSMEAMHQIVTVPQLWKDYPWTRRKKKGV